MKTVSSGNSWIVRSHQTETPTPPLTPTYTKPRLAPKPPPSSTSPFKSGFNSVFRKPAKPPSINSAYSASSSSEIHPSHPYSAQNMPPLPVVSNHSAPDDDDECPVCLEPLSFSFRLPGEKPHIVPECGHALHEVRLFFNYLLLFYNNSIRPASPPSMVHLQISREQQWQENLI